MHGAWCFLALVQILWVNNMTEIKCSIKNCLLQSEIEKVFQSLNSSLHKLPRISPPPGLSGFLLCTLFVVFV